MEEIVFWKEVDESESDAVLEETYLKDYGNTKIASSQKRFLKRVVVNILSDQEIWALSEKDKWQRIGGLWGSDIEKCDKGAFENGYKAMQERLIGGQGS